MKKLFIIIVVVSGVMVLAITAGFFWLSNSAMTASQHDAQSAVVNGAARMIGKQTFYLTEIIQGIAEREDVRTLITNKDFSGLLTISKHYEDSLPGVMKIRIILPGKVELDRQEIPHLGYADLEMIRETFKANQPPMVQGDKGPNRHLAVTRGVVIEDQVVAVILASFEYAYLQKSINNLVDNDIRVELKQGNVVLAGVGKASEEGALSISKPVAGTKWQIRISNPAMTNKSNMVIYLVVFAVALLIIIILSVFGYIKTKATVNHDLQSLLKVTADLIKGKTQGNYPAYLPQIQEAITEISRLKVTDSSGVRANSVGTPEKEGNAELTLHDFFEDFAEDKTVNEIALFEEQGDQPNNEPLTMPEQSHNDGLKSFIAPHAYSSYKPKNSYGLVAQTSRANVMTKVGQVIASDLKDKGFDTVVFAKDGHGLVTASVKAFETGLLSMGLNILNIGEVPIPVLYFAAHYHKSHTGIMMTGSANSDGLNGVKVIVDGEFLSDSHVQQYQQRIKNSNFKNAEQKGVIEINDSLVKEYILVITKEVALARPLKVVVDCGNGVASVLAPAIFRELGCQVISLHCDVEGQPSNFDASLSEQEVLNDLIEAVKQNQADVGFAIYDNGVRLDVVDNKGNVISPDQQMIFYAKDVLKLIPDARIIYDPMCSGKLVEAITSKGGEPIMSKANPTIIRSKLKHEKASFAGSMSGQFSFNDRWFGFDDGIYSAARMLELISLNTEPSSAVFAKDPIRMHNSYFNLPMAELEAIRFVKKLSEVAIFPQGKINYLDCLRVDFDDGLGVVSCSPTLPTVLLRFEADNEQALKRIQNDFKQYMIDVKPGMKIPF